MQAGAFSGRSQTIWGMLSFSMVLLSVLLLFAPHIQSEADPTRSTIIYIGSVEGEGSDGDILLAGYGWYRCNFTLIDWIGDVDEVKVIMDLMGEREDLFDYVPSQDNLTVLDPAGLISVREPLIILEHGTNLTFTFKIWVHLNWSSDRSDEVTLIPRVYSNSTPLDLDSPNLLRFRVHGKLRPLSERIDVLDSRGNEVNMGGTVRSGSTVLVSGISFEYEDSQNRFSGMKPDPGELKVGILSDGKLFNATYQNGGFNAEVDVPQMESGEVELSISVDGVRGDWLYDVSNWAFTLLLDGIGPKIDMLQPTFTRKEPDTEFQWNISLKDRPKASDVLVNGSSVSYRVWTSSGNWTPWIKAEPVMSDRSIFVTGSAVGQEGSGNTLIQFTAEDELGNVNVSEIFGVWINVAPVLEVPVDFDGMVLLDNQSLDLEGEDFASDEDGDLLQYNWYLDNSDALSTLSYFRKPLFDVEPGEHVITLEVSDGVETVKTNFTITVKKAPRIVDERTWFEKFRDDDNFFIYVGAAGSVILFLILVFLILFISRKVRERSRDDFVIDENNTLDRTQAEETARRILESMSASEAAQFDMDSEAQVEENDFDFDYNLYEVLGVDPNAPEEEIKKKYRKLAAFYHPDRVQMHGEVPLEDAREHMVKVNKAKEILLDPEMRAMYDEYLSDIDFVMDDSGFEKGNEEEEGEEEETDMWD